LTNRRLAIGSNGNEATCYDKPPTPPHTTCI
jgi:hypothetical protein